MEQLPGSDAVFLAMETDTVYGHIGGLTILDPTGAPRFDFARLARSIDARIRRVPRFTQKLRRAPLDLDRPYLVDDPRFDVEKHLRRIALPAPGGLRRAALICRAERQVPPRSMRPGERAVPVRHRALKGGQRLHCRSCGAAQECGSDCRIQ